MNLPSRSMPAAPAPAKMTIWGWLVLTGLAVAFIATLITSDSVRWGVGVCAVLFVIVSVFHHLRDRRLRKERKEESICSFARALPARDHDTWVVRAVYEELSRAVSFPIRPTDEIEKFLGVVGEDLDDLAVLVAHRAMRSMDRAEMNPMYNRVVTVADVILFLENQPNLPNQRPERNAGATSPSTSESTPGVAHP